LPLLLLRNPYSLASEGFRIIRSAIQLSSPDHPYQVVHVVSASEGEGKSCVSAHLAAALAMSGKRTILIDADMRRPSIHKYYRYNRDAAGLAEVLTGQVELESVTHDIAEVEGLTVLPAGGSVPNPVELLGSQRMARLIAEIREQYDMIVIDSPPVAAMADALVLTGIADGSLFVVRSAKSPRQHLQNSLKRLVGSGGRIVGTVLNDYSVRGNGYYGAYGYGQYGERGDDVRRKAA
jgi:capsular exopolysaccharide synthesis family protein